ncbi:MAG TPA: hypothetical protein VMU02_04285 [bacterium]|nr:hypothetical protein [bacterium]
MRSAIARPFVIVLATVVAIAALSAPGFCFGKMFGVRPGEIVQTAYFGFGSGAIVPLVGIDFLSISASVEDTDISASLYIPHAGVRFYLSSKNALGNVRPYVEGAVLHSIASVDLGGLSSDYEKMAEDALSFWGFTGIFGCEYYFSERFSVAGEYGMRYIRSSTDLKISAGDIITNPIDSKLKVSYEHSYTAAALNFHF